MNYKIFLGSRFKKEFKRLSGKYVSLKINLKEVVDFLKENPVQGISLGDDCYKIRLAISSKGK